MMIRRRLALLPVLGFALLVSSAPALATTSYTSVVGTNVSFTGIQESSSWGDAEPLFDQPTGSGDQLLFFPPNFLATAAGAGGFDATGSQLQLTISGNTASDIITTVMVSEFGDATLIGVGTAATSTTVSLSGFLTVMENIDGPISPVIINFVGTFTPSDSLALPGDSGTTIWSGGFSVDVSAYVPNATVVKLSMDNDLYAFSEAGTSAKIQKKVVDGPAVVITVIPEPGTAVILGGGLLVLGLLSRRSRA